MDDIRVLLGNRIRVLRRDLKLSQEALAFRADLDRTYVASIESGRRNVSIINILRLATALECSLSEFFNSDEFSTIPEYLLDGQVAENDFIKYK